MEVSAFEVVGAVSRIALHSVLPVRAGLIGLHISAVVLHTGETVEATPLNYNNNEVNYAKLIRNWVIVRGHVQITTT